MANQNPNFPTYRSGFTGPSEHIGGSSEYHIDMKMLSELPLSEKIRALDSLAKQYKSIGREIEFSNEGVSGRRWNPEAPLEEKVALFEAVRGAHAPRQGWDPLDFYVPFAGKSRFDKGAVEGASIFIPGVPGGKITRGSGGGYGFFSEAQDPGGRVVFRVGHGDIRRPEAETEIAVEANATQPPQETASGKKSADELLIEKLDELLKPQPKYDISKYEGPSEESFQKTNELIDQAAMKLLLDEMSRREQKGVEPRFQPRNAGAIAAQIGEKSFVTPKSLI